MWLAAAIATCRPVSSFAAETPVSQYTKAVWTETEGMPSSLVWAITQDADGYLWLGTDAGLIRFDGVRFVPWDAIGRTPLPVNTVRALHASRSGDLWIGLGVGGVSRIQDGALTTYGPADGVPERVVDFLEDRSGAIWAAGFVGLGRFDGQHWKRVGPDMGVSEQVWVTRLYEDRQGALWATTPEGMLVKKPGHDRFERLELNERPRAVVEDLSGNFWGTGARQGIWRLDGSQPSLTKVAQGVAGTRLLRDRQGNLWAATLGRGVIRVSSHPAGTTPSLEFVDWAGLSASGVIRSLFEDREGNIWIGSQRGLIRLSEKRIVEMAGTLEETEAIRAVAAGGDDSVWIGTENGLYRFAGRRSTRYDMSHGLPNSAIGALHVDKRGVLWVATDRGGVVTFEHGRFVGHALPSSPRLELVEALTTDDDGGLWLLDLTKGVYRWKDGELAAVGDADVRGRMGLSTITDRQGRVWLGFADGTVVVFTGGKARSYTAADGLPGGAVSSLWEDADGSIWVGADKGLGRFTGGRFAALPAGSGFPGVNIRSIVQDRGGDLWFGVNSGIVRLPPREFARAIDEPGYRMVYSLYDIFDGLRGVPMSVRGYPTAVLGGNGKLWFATSSGLAMLDPDRERTRVAPPVRVEQLLADNHIVDGRSARRLPPLTSQVQIDYTGLSLTVPARIQFRYRLDGYDTHWIDAGARRQAFYTNLPPRQYRFRVVAGNDGAWTPDEATIDFSILPTFYQTPAFRAAIALLVFLGICTMWQLRARRTHRQFALVLAERTRVAREIHDTLLQSLVGVAFQFDALTSEVDDAPQAAKSRVERLRSQIEMYIREARQSIWDLRSPTLETLTLTTALRRIADSHSHEGVHVDVTVTGTPDRGERRVEEALFRIGQEAISNAVRHAAARRVAVELTYAPGSVTLRVTDDGRGFEADPEAIDIAHHAGLATMRERAKQVRGRFTMTSHAGSGTEISVVVPVGHAS